jgi:hypothetical protein
LGLSTDRCSPEWLGGIDAPAGRKNVIDDVDKRSSAVIFGL